MISPGRPNVVMLVLDTVSSSHLSLYGGRLKLKNIDRIARKSILYKNAISPGTYTVPSHVSLFLGSRVTNIASLKKDPMKNFDENVDPFLKKSKYIDGGKVTLARHLSYIGYNTALFSNNPFVTSSTGIAEGFSYIDNIFIERKIRKNKNSVKIALGIVGSDITRKNLIKLSYHISRFIPQRNMDDVYIKFRKKLNAYFSREYGFQELDKGANLTNERIGEYLGHVKKEDNFIFVNYMEGHEGYPTELVKKEYIEQDKWLYMSNLIEEDETSTIKEAYGKRIQYLDGKIGELVAIMKEKGILDNAILIILSDHGQGFMEHNIMYHNMFPYEELVKVPLVIGRFMDGKQVGIGEVVEESVSLTALNELIMNVGYGKMDAMNTPVRKDKFVFSDHVGITEVWDTQLLKLLRKRSTYVDKIYKTKIFHNTQASAIYNGNYKMIHYYSKKIQDELYDISMDPTESENIIGENRTVALGMLKANSNPS